MRALVAAWVLGAAAPATAAAATPFSAHVAPRGAGVYSALVGFPRLEIRGQWGLGGGFDLGASASSAWGYLQRGGVEARWSFEGSDGSATALRLVVDGAVAGARDTVFAAYDGRQDASGGLEFVGSFAAGASVMTLAAGVAGVMTRQPPPVPLGGSAATVAFGVVTSVRLAVEWPLESGLVLSMPLGLDLHVGRLNPLWAVPTVGLACGYVL
jgi:hypothetical protein